jgi:hypothetical protein
LTEQEQETLTRLKTELRFDSVRDLFLFSLSVVEKLYGWNRADYSFFIGTREKGDQGEYKEVEFEFKPGFRD